MLIKASYVQLVKLLMQLCRIFIDQFQTGCCGAGTA